MLNKQCGSTWAQKALAARQQQTFSQPLKPDCQNRFPDSSTSNSQPRPFEKFNLDFPSEDRNTDVPTQPVISSSPPTNQLLLSQQCENLRRDVIKELQDHAKSITSLMNECMVELTTTMTRVLSPPSQNPEISRRMDDQCEKMARRLTKKIKRKLGESFGVESVFPNTLLF
ncbi:hypothetical protein ACOME3_007985 [Neoechinorhynchus agilis]